MSSPEIRTSSVESKKPSSTFQEIDKLLKEGKGPELTLEYIKTYVREAPKPKKKKDPNVLYPEEPGPKDYEQLYYYRPTDSKENGGKLETEKANIGLLDFIKDMINNPKIATSKDIKRYF